MKIFIYINISTYIDQISKNNIVINNFRKKLITVINHIGNFTKLIKHTAKGPLF